MTQFHRRSICNGEEVQQWMLQTLHTLEAKVLTEHLALPTVYRKRLQALDINELSIYGEDLLISTIKYLPKNDNRLKYVKLLIENGINVNTQDQREKRTALMYACIQDDCTDEGVAIINAKRCNLVLQDRLGNTALMYAAMKGRETLTNQMAIMLSRNWGLSAMQLKNCMGNTAEELAIRNDQFRCARMVQAQRLHMLACLNRQMDLVGPIGCRQWLAFATVFKCIEKWKPRQRRNSAESIHSSAQQNGRKKSL